MTKNTSKILALIVATSIPAKVLSAPEDCAKIGDNSARLVCYDDLFGVQKTHTPVTQSKWKKTVNQNAMTDTKDVFLTLQSDDPVKGKYTGTGYGILYIRCMEDTTAIQFRVADHFLADIQGYGKVEYRLDESSMQSRNFQESTNNETLGLWRGSQAIPFIKPMLGKDRMIVRITPFNNSPILMTFSISQIETEIVELRETCKW